MFIPESRVISIRSKGKQRNLFPGHTSAINIKISEMYKPRKTTNFATQIFLITLGQLMPEPQMS